MSKTENERQKAKGKQQRRAEKGPIERSAADHGPWPRRQLHLRSRRLSLPCLAGPGR